MPDSSTFLHIENEAHGGAFGHNPAPAPTEAQCRAGNYKMGRITLHGLSIAIEQPRGTYRTGIDSKTGKRWASRMAAHYGYFAGTKGNDGDGVDCFVGFYPQSEYAYVVNQNIGGRFDEHKVMTAFPDEETARRAYLDSYDRGWPGLASIVPASISQLKWWLKHGNMKKPLKPEHLPHEGLEAMTRRTQWNADALPYDQTLDQLIYDIRRSDDGDNLLLDSVSLADILEDSDGALAFDALVTPYAALERKMGVLQRVMERTAQTVKPVAMQVTEPFTQRGVANVAVLFELTDGQTVSIYFHNPDVTPKKITGTDEVISWRWMLNKKDITIVVAPERGEDINISEVARRIMKLAEKNSAAFMRANGKRAERMAAIGGLKTEIAGLEVELKSAQHDLEVAQIEAEDRAAKVAKEGGDVRRSNTLWSEYQALKSQNPDALLAHRAGDFYEFMGDDAKTVANAEGLTLTRRGEIPMAGFGVWSLTQHLDSLVKNSFKVAVSERDENGKSYVKEVFGVTDIDPAAQSAAASLAGTLHVFAGADNMQAEVRLMADGRYSAILRDLDSGENVGIFIVDTEEVAIAKAKKLVSYVEPTAEPIAPEVAPADTGMGIAHLTDEQQADLAARTEALANRISKLDDLAVTALAEKLGMKKAQSSYRNAQLDEIFKEHPDDIESALAGISTAGGGEVAPPAKTVVQENAAPAPATVQPIEPSAQSLIAAYIKAWGTEADKINAALAAVNWVGVTDFTSARSEETKLRTAVSAAKDIDPARKALTAMGIESWDNRLAGLTETPEFKAHAAAMGAYRAATDKIQVAAKDGLKKQGAAELAELPDDAPIEDYARAIFRKNGMDTGDRGDWVASVVTAIKSKDADALRGIVGNTSNKSSRAIFERHTGIKLAKTQALSRIQADTWCGITPEQRSEKEASKDAAYQAKELAGTVKRTWDYLTNMKVRSDGEIMDGQQWVLKQAADGYNEVGTMRKGAVPLYGLVKGSGNLSYVKNTTLTAFLKSAMQFGGLKQALVLVGALTPEVAEQTPVATVDAAYTFASATDAFKLWIADSVGEADYSPFATAKAMDLKASELGGSIDWSVSTAALDSASESEDLDGGDSFVNESEIGEIFEPEDIDLGSAEDDDFDAGDEFDAAPDLAEDDSEVEAVMDGDFKNHPFRGNQFKKASHESGAAVHSSMRAKRAERRGDAKSASKANESAHYSHKAASVSATGKAKKYHDVMAKFHGQRAGVTLDSVMGDAVAYETAIGVITAKGEIAGRAHIGGDGKAMVYVGPEGLTRVVFEGGTRAVWSDNDAAEMVGVLLVTPKDIEVPPVVPEAQVPAETDVSRLNAADRAAPKDSIFSDDPQAIEKLEAKLKALVLRQELMKKANKFFKSGDDAGLLAMGLSQMNIDGLKKPDFAGRTGFADYLLTNNNGVIGTTRKRLESLIASQLKSEAPTIAPSPLPLPIIVEDPQMTADKSLFQSVIDNTVPDILAPELADTMEAAYLRHVGNTEMETLFEAAVNAYMEAGLTASANL